MERNSRADAQLPFFNVLFQSHWYQVHLDAQQGLQISSLASCRCFAAGAMIPESACVRCRLLQLLTTSNTLGEAQRIGHHHLQNPTSSC